MQLLTLEESIVALTAFRVRPHGTASQPVSIPRRVVQFWDRDPPDQIRKLLQRNQALCAKHGVEYRLFDLPEAQNFLRERGPDVACQAFDLAEHPAMKCDVFRLAYLWHEGGYYVDADLVLRDNLPRLIEMPGQALVFQWDHRGLTNLCNWLIGSQAGHASIESALLATSQSVLEACRADPSKALQNILIISGPGIFTRGIGSSLTAAGDTLEVQTVAIAHQLIQLGPEFLKQALSYKNSADPRHWKSATGASGAPVAVQAPPVPASLGQRLARWITGGKA